MRSATGAFIFNVLGLTRDLTHPAESRSDDLSEYLEHLARPAEILALRYCDVLVSLLASLEVRTTLFPQLLHESHNKCLRMERNTMYAGMLWNEK